jgi:uncharacterized protein (DUF1778 family)
VGDDRTVLLINCSTEEAKTIRDRAQAERRTLSGYVLHTVMRAVLFEERLSDKISRLQALNRTLSRGPLRLPGPRTTILLRCNNEESRRIRLIAARREMSISAFVLHSLRRAWTVAGLSAPPDRID